MKPLILCDYSGTLDRLDSHLLTSKLEEFEKDCLLICIATDGDSKYARMLWQSLTNEQHQVFKGVYGIDKLSYEKYSPQYWEKGAPNCFGSAAREICFLIDDDKDNIDNAQKNGVACFLIEKNKTMIEMLPELEDAYQQHRIKLIPPWMST